MIREYSIKVLLLLFLPTTLSKFKSDTNELPGFVQLLVSDLA